MTAFISFFFPRIFHSSYRCFTVSSIELLVLFLFVLSLLLSILFFLIFLRFNSAVFVFTYPSPSFALLCPFIVFCISSLHCSCPFSYFLSVFLLLFGFLTFLLSFSLFFPARTIILTKSSFS
jgi:hypothetical protein